MFCAKPGVMASPVKVSLKDVPFHTNESLFVPFMNVKVASSSLWKNKTGEVSEKLGFSVGEEEIEQDWTYLNAYEGLMTWKNEPEGNQIYFYFFFWWRLNI
jgi:hypothetical protein